MKRFYLSKLVTLIVILLGFNWSSSAQTTTFSYTGSVQSFVVPAGCTNVAVDVRGAQGGNYTSPVEAGGKGGRVQCNLPVTPGQTLYIYVGQQAAASSCGSGSAGGSNSGGGGQGGNAAPTGCGGSGGGGSSDIRTLAGGTITELNSRLVVGAGGGGSGYDCGENGGDGGGLVGSNGNACGSYSLSNCGGPGTQLSGGGAGSSSTAGTFGAGGNAYCCYYGAGGGGGYYGGGGAYSGSACGGSSYASPSATSVVHTGGFQTGNGSVSITPLVPAAFPTPSALLFPSTVVGGTSAPQTFTFTANTLSPASGNLTVTAPAGFLISPTGLAGSWVSSFTVAYTGSIVPSTTVWVEFVPVSYALVSLNVTISGGGIASPANVNVSGTGSFPCSGTPTAGTVAASPTSASVTTPITLSISGSGGGGGLTYQWQSSSFSTFGFTNIGPATGASYTFTGLTSSTYFRCVVTCPGSGLTATSTAVLVNYTPPAAACIPTYYYASSGYVCSNNMGVGSSSNPFRITGASGTAISDNTGCIGSGYQDQTSTYAVTLNQGGSYTATVGTNVNGYSMGCQIWIDFNNDGNFSSTESVGGGNWTSATISAPVTIPSTVPLGTYRMRVTSAYACCGGVGYPSYPNVPSCTNTATYYAESRDYTVTIQGPACAGTPVPGTISATVASGCGSPYSSTLVYSPADIGSGYGYKWQSSSDNVTFSNIAGATNIYYNATAAATTYYRTIVSCGTFTVATTSQQLALNPVPTVTGASSVCMPNVTVLTGAPAGGTWTSGNTAVANVGLGTGVVSGVGPGAGIINYTAPTGCIKTVTLAVNNGPANITGSSSVCVGSNTTLANSYAGGVWSSSNTALATIGSSTGIVGGALSGTPSINYTLANGCSVSTPITVNPLPAAISGASSVCIGASTNMTDATPGGAWVASTFAASVGLTSGIVTGVSAGTPNIIYKLPTGCSISAPITVNILPSPITGTMSACAGATSTLADGSGAGTWTSDNTSIANVAAGTGVVSGIAAGSANIKFALTSTGCTISTPFTVNAKPVAFNVTGGGGYCSTGSGVHIGLNGSAVGVNYQLMSGATMIGSPVAGSAAAIDFGLVTGGGSYTVQATDGTTSCTQSMTGTASVAINMPPNVYTMGASANYCPGGPGVLVTLMGSDAGVSYQLYNGSTPVGSPVLGSGGTISLGTQMAGTYTAIGTNSSTLCSSPMSGSSVVGVNTPPTVYNLGVMGGGLSSYCLGGLGVDLMIDNSDAGVTYNVYRNGGSTPVASVVSTGGMINFGTYTAGTYTAVANDLSTGCKSNMAGSVSVSVNPLPVVFNVTGGGNYCVGTTSNVHVGLNHSAVGTDYELFVNTVSTGIVVHGSNSGIDFGAQSTPGAYTVVATTGATGCTNNMAGSVTVGTNPVPNVNAVTGGGGYCLGDPSGVHVGLSGSDAGVNYQLYRGSAAVGSTVIGTGSGSIDFGAQTVAGTYSVGAVNATTGCAATMLGSVPVSINPLPVVYNVTGGGNYCAGDPGAHIYLNNSTVGIDYQVMLAGSPVGLSVPGNGTLLDLGMFTTPGIYTVVAKNTPTGCMKNMNGSVTIGINPLPAAYPVSGGGSYCVGGTGYHIYLGVSNTGVSYQLLNGGVPVPGGTMSGTGFRLDFGIQSAPGSYTVMATNTTTTCSNLMTGSSSITVNPLPTVYTVSGTGQICAGDPGLSINLSGSDLSTNYQLYRGTTPVTSMTGTGTSLVFGPYTNAGNYSIVATDPTTCTTNMAASATITVNPLPAVYNVTGGGDYCASAAGAPVGLSNSQIGVSYQLMMGTTTVGLPVSGTGGVLNFGLNAAGVYTATAMNPLTTCANNMAGSVTAVSVTPVTPVVTFSAPNGDTVCVGSHINYTARVTDGGTAPTYRWTVGTASMGSGSSFSYVPANGDVVTATVTSNAECASPATAVATHTVSVMSPQMPTATIALSGSTALKVCAGTSVSMSSTITNGGDMAGYSWQKNGFDAGTGSTFSFVPADGDVIFLVLHSNFACRSADYAYSNNLAFNVDQPTPPSVTLSADPGANISKYQSVIFTASTTAVQGTSYTYAWKYGSNVVAGATSGTYTPTNQIADNDVVSATVSGINSCGTHSTTQTITMHVTSLGIAPVSGNGMNVVVVPNPNHGTFAIKGSLGNAVDEVVTLEVTNMVGQVVYTGKTTAQNGNIDELLHLDNSLSNGMYILNVRTSTENKPFHFVIEK